MILALRRLGAVAIVFAAACAHNGPKQSTHRAVAILGSQSRPGIQRIDYTGRWEFVRKRRDGRFQGASVRSFHVGNSLSFVFSGAQFRIYGVTGPNGGYGKLNVAGKHKTTMNFYSPAKRTHTLLYTSPPLTPGMHRAAIIVESTHDHRSRGTYVNIDELEIVKAEQGQ